MELASALESKLGQKWRYGALKPCVKGMYRLKLISRENNLEFKGLNNSLASYQSVVMYAGR